ncbi:LLM class F420-dependent oxidoreductase [Candidatus Entotheonella serta]|nr:LLM class F420-dependent oxidoreductase [Candidatus Entotheonella serta]
MKFGVFMFPTGYAINPVELGKTVEELGFESLFFPEHTHIPASRLSPFPGGGELPREYSNTLDPFVALVAVASATERLLLGTGICLVIERDPITLAKEVASLDFISNGRVLFGIGGGWNREEMENHGTDPRRRWKLLRERIEAMKAIWTQEEAEYHGEFVNFDPIWQFPKPVQKPHPPILVGGDGENTLKRVVNYGDGWLPIGRRADFKSRIDELNHLAAEAGRGTISVSIFGAPPKPEVIEQYAEAGVQRVLFNLPPAPRDEVLPLLEAQAKVAKQF